MNKFTEHFLIAGLWATNDDNGDPLDDKYSIDDIDEESMKKADALCDKFRNEAGPLLDEIDDEQGGHDFFLTANRHGVGYWDRGLGEVGEKLTEIAHKYGEIYFYVGDNGKIHIN